MRAASEERRPYLAGPIAAPVDVTAPLPAIVDAPAVATPSPVDRPRRIGRRSPDDWYRLLGAIAASGATCWLIYTQMVPFSGKVGFVIAWYLSFIAFYAGLTAMAESRAAVADRIASAAVHGAAVLVAFTLGSVIIYTFIKGWPAYHHLNFFTSTMGGIANTAPLTQGGIKHAIVGTGIELGLAVAVSLPLGLTTAVYLTEVGGRLANAVRTVIEAMTALPDLVAGLFIYATLIVGVHWLGQTGLAAALALAITMLPIIARSSEVVLRTVPSGLREASAALGSPQWRTVVQVVLPTARSGLATALILGMARGVGETAPVLIASGVSAYWNANPLSNRMNSLPLFVFDQLRNTGLQPVAVSRAYGAASVLLALILLLFVFVRFFARERKAAR